ncbi:hypothetical protein [Pelagibacterium halotolerans]|uniref:hypothetical protein n=1 Tax=Pelagibacterium halotolerans TaxID=531813 RepID=UPI00384D29B8
MIGVALTPHLAPSKAWWPAGNVYAADFVQQRFMNDGVHVPQSAAFTFTRASNKLAQAISGEWKLFPPDTPAITGQGLFYEPEETFYPVNALFEGALPGILGSGGALPAGWTVLEASGLSIDVIETGLYGDVPYIRLRLFGTTDWTDVQIALNATTQAAATNETWTAALSLRHVAGATGGIIPYVRAVEETDGAFVAATTVELPWSSDFTRASATRLIQSGATNNVRARFRLILPDTGISTDMTIDLHLPALAKSASPGSPLLTDAAAPATRGADVQTLSLPAGNRLLTVVHGQDEETTFTDSGGPFIMPTGLTGPIGMAFLA